MKKILLFIILLFFVTPVLALQLPVEVTAESAIVINQTDHIVLYTKNADDKKILASLTKIMTAYTVIKNVSSLNFNLQFTSNNQSIKIILIF